MSATTENITTMEQERSAGLSSLTKSLIAVQRAVQGAKPNKANPHLKSKYADLASIWDTCRELLATNGMAVTHTFRESPAADTVTCVATLLHESGEFITSSLTLKPGKTTPQEMGSAITDARRYTLAALVGIVVDDDDDGAKASADKPEPKGIELQKGDLRKLLNAYKGPNREELIGECAIANDTGNMDEKFIKDIISRMRS